ncbi:hypothetical protein VZT92_022657 [Zoarces viviparus]|uniref:MCF.2 cell line derived transforming sequence-like 2 n=1 Tax=Zoarces viviparus TaxID=48416 RepID=A0AAW1ECZ8_ZOAVI
MSKLLKPKPAYTCYTFLRELENCAEKPELVGTCFLKRKEELQVYEKYCQNKPRSEVLWRQCGDSLFFQECRKKLDHKLSLDAYLLKPVQRITKYQLMLKEMLKCSKGEGTAELEEALSTMLDIIKSVNDSMHQIAITGFEGNLSELGKLLMQGSFNVWTDHKKGHSKVKDLARFKPMQRHLFLYDKMMLFCKKREETTDGHEKTPSYSFKHSLKMSSVGITENVKGDIKKFEVWYNGREEVYIIQAPSMDVKNMWVSEIRKVLTGQLEACREASQLNIYGAPMRNVRKMALRQSDSSSPESGFRRSNPSPNMRQKRVDASAGQSGHSAANARKRFTLQGLSNRRSLQAGNDPMQALTYVIITVTGISVNIVCSHVIIVITVIILHFRSIYLASVLSSVSTLQSQNCSCPRRDPPLAACQHNEGHISLHSFSAFICSRPLSASIKSKRHEIKSDPTPFGYEDTLRGAMAAVRKRQSMTSSTAAAGGTSAVPRSTSQPGWAQRRLPSMDTDDFETIPSSAEESSNSSEEEGNNKDGDGGRFRVQLTYESRDGRDLSLEVGDMVQFVEEAESGHW